MAKRGGRARQKNSREIRFRQIEAKRKKKIISDLNRDEKFLAAQEKTWRRLVAALKTPHMKPEVERFFRVFPSCAVVSLVREFLATVRDKKTRELLWDYVKFSLRYDVEFVLHRNGRKGRIKLDLIYPEPKGDAFQVKIVHGKTEPVSESRRSRRLGSNFEMPVEEIPEYCQQQVNQGEARYIRVDDRSVESLLTDFEHFAYDAEKVVFIEHRAEKPYLLLLIGGKVSKKILRNAQKTITKFQRTQMGSRLAGRKRSPKTLDKMRKIFVASRKKGISGIDLGYRFAPEYSYESKQNFVSMTKKLLKK